MEGNHKEVKPSTSEANDPSEESSSADIHSYDLSDNSHQPLGFSDSLDDPGALFVVRDFTMATGPVQDDCLSPSLVPLLHLPQSSASGLSLVPLSSGLTQKRGPGRPRKDGTSGPIQRKKIFPGRPRMRTRKGTHKAILPPSSSKPGLGALGSEHPSFIRAGTSLLATSPNKIRTNLAMHPRLPKPLQFSTGAVSLLPSNLSSSMDLDETKEIKSLGKLPELSRVSPGHSLEDYSQDSMSKKVCAFCNLGENSLLGQGDLAKFEPSVDFSPFKKGLKCRRNSSESESSMSSMSAEPGCSKFSPARRGKGPLRVRGEHGKGIRRSIGQENQSIMGPADELELVGFIEEPDVTQVFESTGHVYAHHCCAAWSESVCQTEEYYLVNVDKAVYSGMSQKCSRCKKFGATIRCRAPKCTRVYHYPCATSSGTFQDIKTLTLLCPFHLLQAPELAGIEANCQVCDNPGVVSELLFCTSCGQHYHGLCLDPPVEVNPVVRAGWQCPECKICQTCRQPGDDNRMLVCDTCDKGFHTFCLKPVMATIPKNGWKCKSCRVCGDCNSRTPGSGPSSRWHLNYTVCDSCYQQRNKGIACPLCGKAYRQFCQRADMVHCTVCRKYIHMDCDSRLEKMKDPVALNSYVCPVCINLQAQGIVPGCLPALPEPMKIKDEREAGPSFLFEPTLGSPEFSGLTEDSNAISEKFENPFSKVSSFMQGLPEPMNLTFEESSPPSENRPVISSLYRPMVGGKFPGKKRMGFSRLRGSGKFAGRRRAKTAELRRKRGPKPKVRTLSLPGSAYFPIDPMLQEQIGLHSNASDSRDSKQDDEPTVDNKIILCSATDEFVLSQDLCVMCGSFGQGEEGKLIVCSQCGQCYHPYCVNIKITKVILKKGWRCLDCTVCEGCGKPHDESRLLLCDDCDISYHTYCLDPPLEVVPEGNWKCKWCVKCIECLSTSPGLSCVWQNNYTLCGPCGSKNSCPVCQQSYQDQDLVIQCIHCDRWLHGVCDQMLTEEDAEKAADFGYHCLLCRPSDEPPPHLIVEEQLPLSISEELTFSKSLEHIPDDPNHQMDDSEASQLGFGDGGFNEAPKTKPQAQFMMDGVLLSESGLSQIKALTIEQPKKQRVRRTKLQRSLTALGLSHLPSTSSELSQPPLILPPAFTVAESRMIDNADLALLSEASKDASKEDLDAKVEADLLEKKKRQRKLQKLGIGGFQVKPRGRGLSKDSVDSNEFGESMNNELQIGELAEMPPLEKPKRRRRAKKKSHLEDSYPNYIQEAFFGKDLLSTSKDISKVDLPLDDETNSSIQEAIQEKIPIVYSDIPSSSGPSVPTTMAHPTRSVLTPPPPVPSSAQQVHHPPPQSGLQLIHQGARPSIGHPQVRTHHHQASQPAPLIIPPPIRQTLPMVVPAPPPPPPPPPPPVPIATSSVSFAGKLLGVSHQELISQREDSLDKSTGDADDSNSKDEDLASGESLKDLLPLPQDDELMDMLIGDDELTKRDDNDLGLPQMDSKDVEDIFKDVLSPDNLNEQSSLGSTGMSRGAQQSPAHGSQPSRPPSLPPQTSIHLPGPSTPSSVPSIGSPFSIPPPSPYPSEYSSGTSQFSPQVPEQQLSPWRESEAEPQSHSHKSNQKWENDEALGTLATISPVLYANLIHPNLKVDYPIWTDRAKHIAKIWRNLPSDKRQPYLQKARENRTASRMQKSHGVATHGLTPHVPPVGVPQPPPPTPQPESGKGLNQRSQREIEQERQWKHMQVLRQQQQQQQNQILAEQKQQSFIKVAQSVTMEHEVSVEGGFMQVPPSPSMRSGPSPSPSPSTPTTPGYQTDMSSLCQMTANAGMDSALNQGPQTSVQSPASSPFHPSQRSPSSVRSPTSVSPLIQVSRVRPPIDPSRLPSNEQHLGSPGTPRPVENLFLPPYRMPGGPRPGMQHQQQQMLLRPDTPRGQTPSPSAPDFYQTPPSTPCPTPMDQFRQASSPAHGLLHGQDPFLQLSPNPMQQSSANSPYSDSQINQGQMRVSSPLDPYARAPSTPCPQTQAPQISTSVAEGFVMSPNGMTVSNRMMEQQMAHPPQSPVSQMQIPPPPSSPMPINSPGDGFGQQGFKVRPRQMAPHSQATVTNPALVAALKPNLISSPLSPRHQMIGPDGSPMSHQMMGADIGNLGPPPSPSTMQNPMDQIEGDGPQIANRQHLRDLLQRQQMKKQEQMFREQQGPHGQMPLRHWPTSGVGDQNRPGGNANLFRSPLPPGMRPRIMSGVQDQTFRHPGQLLEQRGVMTIPRAALNDPRIRTAIIQQQQQMQQQVHQQLNQIKQMQQQIQQQLLQLQQNVRQVQMQQSQSMQHGEQIQQNEQLQQFAQQQQQLQQQAQQLHLQKQQIITRAAAVWNNSQIRVQNQPRMPTGFTGVKTEMGEGLGPQPQSPNLLQQQQQKAQLEGQSQHMIGQPNILGLQNAPVSSANSLNMASSPLYQQRMMQQQHQFGGPPQSPMGHQVSPSQQHSGMPQHLESMGSNVTQQTNMQMTQPQQTFQQQNQQMVLPPPNPMPKEESNYQSENIQEPMFQNRPREKQDNVTRIKQETTESQSLEKLEEETAEEDILGSTDPIAKKKQTAGDLVKEVEDQDEEALGVDLEDDLDEDDELLGLGNDFNILEYADPELEGGLVGDGEKNNILDEHLDLDEKDDDELGDVDELKTKLEEKVDLNKNLPGNETKKEMQDGSENSTFKLKECKVEKLNPEGFKVEMDNQEQKYNPEKIQTGAMEQQQQSSNFPTNLLSGSSSAGLEGNIQDNNHNRDRPDPVINVAQLLQSQEQRPVGLNQQMQQIPPGLASMMNRGGNLMGERFPRPIQRTVSFPPGMPPPPPYGANQGVNYQGLVGQPRIQHPHTQQELLAHQQRMQSMQNPQSVMTLRHRLQSPNPNMLGIGAPNQEDRLSLPQEQPLLLEDLVEQEKQEQKRQSQESFISPPGDALLSDIDFERLKADVLSCPPDDIGGPSGLMSHSLSNESNLPGVLGSPTGAPLQHFPPPQSPMAHPEQVTQQPPPPPPPVWQQHQQHNVPGMQIPHRGAPPNFHNVQLRGMSPQMMHSSRMQSVPMIHGQHGEMHPRMEIAQGQFGMAAARPPFQPSVPPPPLPPHDPITDQDRQQYAIYEQWLIHQQTVLTSHQKHFEAEVGKLRKNKKALNARQRQLRRNGQELPDHDQVDLSRITQEQTALQKQLDQVRKQIRQHATLFQEFRMKQQKFQTQQQQQQMMHSSQQNPQGHPASMGMQLSPLGAALSPHRPGSVPPPSPMMSPSPMGPSPSPRLQHPPSPMMQHSPSPMMQHSPSPMMQHSPSPMMPQSPMMQNPAHSQAPPSSVSQRSPISSGMMMEGVPGPSGPRMPHQMIHNQQAMHMQQEEGSFDRFQQREQFMQHQKRQMMANVQQSDLVGQPFPANLPVQGQSFSNMSPSPSQQSPLSPMQPRSQFSPRGNASMSLDDINAIILKSPEGRPPPGTRSQIEMDPTRLGSIHRELTSGQTGGVSPMMFRDVTFQRPPMQMNQFQPGGPHHMMSRSPRPQLIMQDMSQSSPVQSHNSPIPQSPRPLSSPLHNSPSQSSMQNSPLIGALQTSPMQSSPVSLPGSTPHYQTRIPSQQASPLHSSPPISQSTSPGSTGVSSSHSFPHGHKFMETSNSPKTTPSPSHQAKTSPDQPLKYENPKSVSMDNEASRESMKNPSSSEQSAKSQSPKSNLESLSDNKSSENSQNQESGGCGKPEGCNTPPPSEVSGKCGRPEGCNTPPPSGNCGKPEGCNTPPPSGNCGRPEGCNTPPPSGNCGRPEGCNTPPPSGNCGRPEGCNTPPPSGNCGRPEGCNTPPPSGNCGRPEGCNTPPPSGNCGRPEGCNTPPPSGNCGRPEGCNTPPPSGNCGRPEGCNTPPPSGNCGRPEGCNTPPPSGNCGRPEGCNTPPPSGNCGRPEGCNTPPPSGNCGRPEGCNTPPPSSNCGRPEGCNTPPASGNCGRPEGCNTPPASGNCGRPEGCNTPPPSGNCGRPEGCNTPPPSGNCGRPEGCNTLPPSGNCGRPEGCNTPPPSGNCGRPEGCNTPPPSGNCGRPEGCNTPPPSGNCGRPEGCNTPPPSGNCGRPEGCNTPPLSGNCGRPEGCNTPPPNDCGRPEGCNTPPPNDCGRPEGCNTPPPNDCGRPEGCNTPPPNDCGRPEGCNTPPPNDCGRPEGCNTPPPNDCGRPEGCNTPPPNDCGRPEGCNTPPPVTGSHQTEASDSVPPLESSTEIGNAEQSNDQPTSKREIVPPSQISNSPETEKCDLVQIASIQEVSPNQLATVESSSYSRSSPGSNESGNKILQSEGSNPNNDLPVTIEALDSSTSSSNETKPNVKTERNYSEIKAGATLETLERVVSSSLNQTSSEGPNTLLNQMLDNNPRVTSSQPFEPKDDLVNVVSSSAEAQSSFTSSPIFVQSESNIRAEFMETNVQSSSAVSSSMGQIDSYCERPRTLMQDVKQEAGVSNKQEEKDNLFNVPLLKIKDEPVDDIPDANNSGRFQPMLRGSESITDKNSGFDKPVQTLPLCSNQTENSGVDELQSSFSQSVTHTLSFTLRQTGMPAGPVSPQPESSKPNIEVSLPVSHIVQQPLTAISQTPSSIVVSTSGNHILAALTSQRLTVPQQASLATLANINPMQITPRPLTPIIKHVPTKTHELHGSLSGRPGPPVMVVGMDGGILRPMEPRGLSLLHLSSSSSQMSVSKNIKDESKSLHSSPCKLIAQEIKAEALAMASCQLLQATKLLGSNLKSPKSDPGCSGIVRIDVARRMSADTLSHNVVEKTEPRPESSESSSQNVLLKQLLQNCPSAESTTPKVEDIPEKIEEGLSSALMSEKREEKTEENKVKKMSYLDVRRAQLEKEPTPPPEDPKAKRKRVKKKKDPKEGGSPTKKRYKKGAGLKVDDGHEVFMENLSQQLRTLPPIRILEPRIKPNFNVCPVPGASDLNAKESCLRGTFGSSHPSSQVDFYSTQPFGSDPPTPPSSLPPTPPPIRGYYNQEFPTRSKDQHGRVDVPISLPTPPPYLDGIRPMRDTDSPDTIVSSSSPECLNMEQTAFTFIKLIDDDRNHVKRAGRLSSSPIIPLVAPIPIRALPSKIFGTDFKLEFDDLEKDKENTVMEEKPDILMLKNRMIGMGTPPIPLKDSANVSVTLTLSSSASEDIMGVLGKLADILKIPAPSTYEIVGRNVASPSQKMNLYRKSKECKDPSAHIHNLLNGKPKFCCHCDIVVLSAGIRKKVSELPYLPKDEMDEDEVIFCSTNCYMQFTLTHRALATTEEKEAAAIVSHTSDCSKQPSPSTEKMDDDDDDETCDNEVKSIKEAKDKRNLEDKDSSLSPLTTDASTPQTSVSFKIAPSPSQTTRDDIVGKPDEVETRDSQETASPATKDETDTLTDEFGRKAEKRSSLDSEKQAHKQWKGQKWRYWTFKIFSPRLLSSDKVESEEVFQNMCICLLPDKSLQDVRKCVLCHNVGDGETDGPARLLNMDVDKWIHLNCALWSAEVYETVNGALINVDLACKRSLNLICCKCHKTGASLKCFKIRCSAIFHFPCAVKDKCAFFKDKTMLCSYHALKLDNRDNELDSLAVLRRVYINRDEHKQIASMIQKGEQNLLRIGSLLFLNIGQLLPHQLQPFHSPNCIYPVGYKVIRMYWSMRSLSQRCQYVCSIHDVEGRPEFHVTVKEKGCEEITFWAKTSKDVWLKILRPIEKMRKEANTIKVFPDFITGDDLLGITEPAILRILESLPGVDTLTNYNFKYGRSPLLELPLAINPTGCARSEPKLRTHFKRPHTLHTRNTSRFSMHNTLSGNEISSPYTKQFVHSKSSQYRKMKTEWRNNVYLARSQIQGLGLYANRDIEKHTMVIEYIGQLIRNEIAERNELIYETQNRGVYMFRLDENRVIDATLCGGLARYMNHCCNPNCVAEVVQIDRENKILIIANRRITRGEELTYDYKFEVEDDQHKIPCLCGAINCRKWMN